MKRIVVELTRAEWLTILRAIDNGAWAGDRELMSDMFPNRGERRRFVNAAAQIERAVGANYSFPKPEDV